MKAPRDRRLEVTIHSEAPTGAGTGTSAAVTVALVGAPRPPDSRPAWRLTRSPAPPTRSRPRCWAARPESRTSWGSAYGGINYIEMFDYPNARVSPIQLANPVWWELERRLVLVYLGKSHDSSALHEGRDPRSGRRGSRPSRARRAAPDRSPLARRPLRGGTSRVWGAAMIANTEAQARLHPALVGTEANSGDRDRTRAPCPGLEGQRGGGRGGLDHPPLRRVVSPGKRALIRAIEGADSRVSARPDLPEPAGPPGVDEPGRGLSRFGPPTPKDGPGDGRLALPPIVSGAKRNDR